MSGGATPSVGIALRDGTELRIGPEGVRCSERVFELARIQDARQIVPDPEIIALRVAGAGMVEFQPARRGDGPIALEALYRLRPDLRPPGFDAPAVFPPYPQTSSASGATPSSFAAPAYPAGPPPPYPPMYPAPGYAPYPSYAPYAPYPPPGMYAPYGIPPYGASDGRLPPVPRSIGDILGAIPQLFGAYWKQWIVIGLLTLAPMLVFGADIVVTLSLLGFNPFGAEASVLPAPTVDAPAYPQFTVSPRVGVIALGGFGIYVLASLFFTPWVVGALGIAGRDALMGRPVRVGRALRGGLRRFFPVLGALLLVKVLIALLFLPLMVIAGFAFYFATQPDVSTAGSPAESALALCILLGLAVFVLTVLALLLVWVRLAVAVYVAATERGGPLHAIGKSWALTRGNWWRTFVPLLLAELVLEVLSIPVNIVTSVSIGGGMLVALPLYAVCQTILLAITTIVILYDLRLRKEGFPAVMAQDEQEYEAASAPAPQTVQPPTPSSLHY